jgi:hypothetical protein
MESRTQKKKSEELQLRNRHTVPRIVSNKKQLNNNLANILPMQ